MKSKVWRKEEKVKPFSLKLINSVKLGLIYVYLNPFQLLYYYLLIMRISKLLFDSNLKKYILNCLFYYIILKMNNQD